MTNGQVDKIINKYVGKEGVLIQLLLEIQRQENWISKDTITRINERLGIPLTDIYRVVSFYTALSLKPRGKHIVRVCAGTACYVRGAQRVLDAAERAIGIKAGETSGDLKFTLETVNCLGCCALGPVVEINGKYHGTATPSQMEQIIERKRSA